MCRVNKFIVQHFLPGTLLAYIVYVFSSSS
jgi:hypothetical protein